jgi:hypothetical protein
MQLNFYSKIVPGEMTDDGLGKLIIAYLGCLFIIRIQTKIKSH